MNAARWACPKCDSAPGQHGTGGKERCQYDTSSKSSCYGFVCECDSEDNPASEADDHGLSFANPCDQANCYHCGWGGKMPVRPKGLQAWERKALEAGWTMPAARARELGMS